MRLIAVVKLQPTIEQAATLLATIERANEACDYLSAIAWETRTFQVFGLHRLAYFDAKARFELSAQVVIRALKKVADAYKLDKKRQRFFRKHGAISYDSRILRFKPDGVSIWALAGRMDVPFVCTDRNRRLLANQRGESDLVYRDGQFYLYTTVDVIEEPETDVTEFLGVDFGVVNIAVDSEGTVYSGKALNAVRSRYFRLRKKLQAKGTKSAKRLLKKRKRKERRFGTWINHNVSRGIVRVAQCTGKGIALENLKGIRSRIKARRPQRRTLHSWSFGQLRQFVTYKAKLLGIPLVLVDPRNTSRLCPQCGHIAKANRQSQSKFLCIVCKFSGFADLIAAGNISRRAKISWPNAASLAG